MTDTQETIADIAQKIRDAGFDELSDHIMAAHKREMSKNVSKKGADFGQLGDAAKLREALETARLFVTNCPTPLTTPLLGCGMSRAEVINIIDAALAAPPRNCDVGTAEEQDRRFADFCVERHSGSCAGCPDAVGGFTVANGIRECALVWAQMPYEEGGAE